MRERTVMLVQLYVSDNDEETEFSWQDFYFDVNTICAFRVSGSKYTDSKDFGIIVHTYGGDTFTFKQEKHIQSYLEKEFLAAVKY